MGRPAVPAGLGSDPASVPAKTSSDNILIILCQRVSVTLSEGKQADGLVSKDCTKGFWVTTETLIFADIKLNGQQQNQHLIWQEFQHNHN